MTSGDAFRRTRMREATRRRAHDIRRWIEQHHTDPHLNLDTIVKNNYVSRRHIFQLVGPPWTIVKQLRMRTAQTLLAGTDLPIGEVTKRIGYKSVGTFATAFKRHTGMTPSRYRQANRTYPGEQQDMTAPDTIPPLTWTCAECGQLDMLTVAQVLEHLKTAHGADAERWPDSAPVIDASDIAEQLTSEGGNT